MSSTERTLLARAAAHESWARTEDRTARTLNGRLALEEKFLREADGDPVRAESLRKAHFARMAAKSVAARRRNAEDAAAYRAAQRAAGQ